MKSRKILRSEWDTMWAALGSDWCFEDGPDAEEDEVFAEGHASETLFEDAFLMWQGSGDPKSVEPYIRASDLNGGHSYIGVMTAIRRWRKKQTTAAMVVEYDKTTMTEAQAKAALKAAGFRVG